MALPMMTATQIASSIAENTGVSKTDVRHVLDDLRDLALSEIESCNRFRLVGLVQLEPKVKPARKARMGRNPATGEDVKIAAKPAQAVVKARLLAEAKNVDLSLSKLRSRITASQTTRKPKAKTTKGKAKKRK